MAKEALALWPLPERYNQDGDSAWESTSMNDETEELFNRFREMIRDYDASIYEEPKKMYINYLRDKKVLFSIVPAQDMLRVTFNVKIEKLTPNDELEDISSKGHWGVGSCRMVVRSENDIWTALEYIQQIISA